MVTSALIYLPPGLRDFANPEIEPYLLPYVRGSHGIEYAERIKIMKRCGMQSALSSADDNELCTNAIMLAGGRHLRADTDGCRTRR